MSNTQAFLLALVVIFSVPYLVWRLLKLEPIAPLAIVQIIGGVLLSALGWEAYGLIRGTPVVATIALAVAMLVFDFGAVLFGIGIVTGTLYILYARRVLEPILDLSLMRIPTFSLAVIGGSLWRIAGGSLPFLMPLMMQLGFGKSAAASGAITFMSSAGSMMMKASAARVLRRFGFRNTMIWNAVIATGLLASCATFRPAWPEWAIYAVLLVTGFFQSLQFTAYNTVAFAEIPPSRSSAAMSFYSTFQQLMLSLGICVAATALNGAAAISGQGRPTLWDFSVAFIVVTAISILAAPVSARFEPRAGEEMSGYRNS